MPVGNPNHSLQNPFKPGNLTVGMQPHNRVNAMTGGMQPQAATTRVPNTAPTVGYTPPRPGNPFSGSNQGPAPSNQPQSFVNAMFGPYMPTITELLSGMVPPVMPYVQPPNIDLYGALLGENRDLTQTSLPLLDAILGQELSMEQLLAGQSNDLLQQLIDATNQTPISRPRSGTSFFRGFS